MGFGRSTTKQYNFLALERARFIKSVTM